MDPAKTTLLAFANGAIFRRIALSLVWTVRGVIADDRAHRAVKLARGRRIEHATKHSVAVFFAVAKERGQSFAQHGVIARQ